MSDVKTETAPEVKSGGKAVKIAVATVVVIALLVAGFFYYTKSVVPSQNYDAAVALLDAGEYEDAIAAFELLEGYKDSADKIQQCKTGILDNEYNAALALMNDGKYTDAIAAFTALDYKDSKAKIEECEEAITDANYNEALALMADEKYVEAAAILKTLDYKDSAEKIEECKAAAPYEFTNIGDIITFGKFEQDYDLENGPDPISWRVLDKQDGKLLIITEKAVQKMPFFAIYWKQSYIGGYLNSEFLYDFTAEEKAMILETTVTADPHPYNPDTDQGAATEHKLFLLSVDEVNKYFANDKDRICYATEYVKHFEPTNLQDDGRCDWWLRTAYDNFAVGALISNVDPNGMVNISSHRARFGLRPACWIQLEA